MEESTRFPTPDMNLQVVQPTNIERISNKVTGETRWMVRFRVLSGTTTMLLVYQVYHTDPTSNIIKGEKYVARFTGGGSVPIRVVIIHKYQDPSPDPPP